MSSQKNLGQKTREKKSVIWWRNFETQKTFHAKNIRVS